MPPLSAVSTKAQLPEISNDTPSLLSPIASNTSISMKADLQQQIRTLVLRGQVASSPLAVTTVIASPATTEAGSSDSCSSGHGDKPNKYFLLIIN
ncbi:unnamed protein product [Protopolystoma xenopodis]|uniref:Uncharacterized protein n=1 Tax=Protopolystoma xenopodis TaxID=117903 RepID=A0A3S5AT57_9PLAT|nr:unnamed protein product [Protopolystoma xenopodis]